MEFEGETPPKLLMGEGLYSSVRVSEHGLPTTLLSENLDFGPKRTCAGDCMDMSVTGLSWSELTYQVDFKF